MRKIKLSDVFVPKYRIYLLIILLILIMTSLLVPKLIPVTLVIYISVLFYTYRKNYKAKERIVKHIDSLIFKLSTDDSILDFPIPATIVTSNGDVLWSNAGLDTLLKGINKEKYIENIIKELDEEFDGDFAEIDKEISIHDKHYRVLGNIVKLKSRDKKDVAIMLYFIDRTDYYRLFKAYDDYKDCVGLIVLDNYEELIQGMSDTDKPQILAILEKRLREWFAFTGGIFVKLDRNRFLIIFERKYLKAFTDSKFEILDGVKEINFSNKIPLTISIAIIAEESSKSEKLQNALSAIDIALGRGGDQAVVKKDSKYEFFGGKSKEIEKRTRVKARVVAQALQQLVSESKNVVIMGHKGMDVDCLGSAVGLYRLAKFMNKDAYIVFNNYGVTIEGMLKRLGKDKSYSDVFLQTDEVASKMTPDTLLIVVDTHKADYVEAPELLLKTNKVAVIDHHRRSTDYIEDPILTFHEVYASSASELVTEMLQYVEGNFVLPVPEAECLYAGILMDTKNFTYKTGVRTFEAAAYLKKTGVDISVVKNLFQNDVDTYVAIADVIRNSEIIHENIAVALCPSGVPNIAQITAQAADELLNLNGIETSFVLCEIDNYISISGRSDGNLNVQMVLEKLGGGGHMMMAGAQVQNIEIEEAKKLLLNAIEEVLNDVAKS